MKVWLAGEGTNDIGSLALGSESTAKYPGVAHVLLAKLSSKFDVTGGKAWKSVPKLRVGSKGEGAEAKTVEALQLQATEAGAEALVFVRDRDEDRARERSVNTAIEAARFPLPTAGGVAVETLEHWLLAIGGQPKSESLSTKRVKAGLQEKAVHLKDTEEYVSWVERQSLDQIPNDARSLQRWLDGVRSLLDESAT